MIYSDRVPRLVGQWVDDNKSIEKLLDDLSGDAKMVVVEGCLFVYLRVECRNVFRSLLHISLVSHQDVLRMRLFARQWCSSRIDQWAKAGDIQATYWLLLHRSASGSYLLPYST